VRNFDKIPKKYWDKLNNPVGERLIPKVNTWVFTFLRKYPGCLKVQTFLPRDAL